MKAFMLTWFYKEKEIINIELRKKINERIENSTMIKCLILLSVNAFLFGLSINAQKKEIVSYSLLEEKWSFPTQNCRHEKCESVDYCTLCGAYLHNKK